MLTWLRRIAGATYRIARKALSQLPGGKWFLGWTDPLHIARRLLKQAVQDRSHYVHGWVLDVGCGEQPYRYLFNDIVRYVGLNTPPNGGVDLYGDGMALPFQKAVFDTVLCNEVLEHVPEPSIFLDEITRVIKSEGMLLLTTPQTWGLHEEPRDFYRYTQYGLEHLAKKSGLEIIEITPTCGMWATLAQRLADTVIFHYAKESPHWVIEILSLLLAPILMMGYGLDKIFGKRGDTLDYVMVAKKPHGS